jgi:uncharacterized membrane protein
MSTVSQSPVQKVQRSLLVNGHPSKVSSLIEDVSRTPEWNPLFTKVTAMKSGAPGPNAELEWEAFAGGKRLIGSSQVLKWDSGKEYAWRFTERDTGQTMEGSILLSHRGSQTEITVSLSYSLTGEVALVMDPSGVNSFLSNAVDQALHNLSNVIAAP